MTDKRPAAAGYPQGLDEYYAALGEMDRLSRTSIGRLEYLRTRELLERVLPDCGAVLSAAVGDARRLEWPDGSAAAVLLLGPLYHLTRRADRVQALREAARVVRPGGIVAAAAITRRGGGRDARRSATGVNRAGNADPARERSPWRSGASCADGHSV